MPEVEWLLLEEHVEGVNLHHAIWETVTTGSYLLMDWHVIHKPFVNIPWTTPPIIGHYLVSGGDWKAAVWGAVSSRPPTGRRRSLRCAS